MTARARLLGLLAALVLPLAAAAQEAPATEPRTGAPAVFFLNARNTGRDFVYLSVGGSPHRPPTNLDQVVLGWSWNEAGTEIPSYPSGVRLGSLPFDRLGEEKDARFWRTSATEASFPPLGIGPGQGLWLLDGEHRAQTWAALLDAVEAAYRQTLIEPPPASDGLATIGHLGSCPVHSLPMPGSDDTWRFLHLPGSARPSLTGGQYFVDPRQATGKTESITTQRYLRWVVNPSNCLQNSNLALRLFPIPGRGSAYFLEFTEVTVRRVGFFALDPEGFHPGVVRLAPTQGPERTVLDLPPAAADLCTYPDLGTMCQRDASRRRQIFTIAPEYGEMLHGQTLTVACQGSLSAASCSDASVWGKKRGPFLMEYQGTLRLHEDPLLTSHLIDGRPVWRLEGSESQAAAGGVLQLRLPGRDSLTLELVPPPPPSSRPDAEGQTTPPSPSSALDPRAWVIATWPWWSVAAGFVVLVLLIGARRRRQRRRRPVPPPSRKRPVTAPSRHRRPATAPDLIDVPGPREVLSPSQPQPYPANLKTPSLEVRAPEEVPPEETPKERAPLPPTEPAESAELAQPAIITLICGLAQPHHPTWGSLRQSLEASDALAQWIEVLLVTLGEKTTGMAETLADHLPLAAAREWQQSCNSVRDFLKRDVSAFRHLLAAAATEPQVEPPNWAAFAHDSGLGNPTAIDSWRTYFCPPHGAGRLDEVAQALQYLVEAYPIEHLEAAEENHLYARLRERLDTLGAAPRFHDLLHDLASGLGYEYRPVRLHLASRAEAEFSFLAGHCDPFDLSRRVGFEVTSDPDRAVRVPLLFLFDPATGARVRGRALVHSPSGR